MSKLEGALAIVIFIGAGTNVWQKQRNDYLSDLVAKKNQLVRQYVEESKKNLDAGLTWQARAVDCEKKKKEIALKDLVTYPACTSEAVSVVRCTKGQRAWSNGNQYFCIEGIWTYELGN